MDLAEEVGHFALLDDEYFDPLVKAFETQGITSQELLLWSVEDISKKTGHPEQDVKTFVSDLKLHLQNSIPKPQTIDDSIPKQTCFTTGDEKLDKALNGGIPCGCLVEISGGSATGKSNFLMTLSMTSQLPFEFGGLGPSLFEQTRKPVQTMYIPTESALSTRRLSQISSHYKELLRANGIQDSAVFPQMENVITPSVAISDLERQDRCIFYQLPLLLQRNKNVKVVILDSVTHHIRAELPISQRRSYIIKLGRFLRKLCNEYNVTVVVANQMTDKPLGDIISDEVFLKMNADYQLGWCYGWDEVGVVYRQLCSRNKQDFDTYDEIDYADYSEDSSTQETSQRSSTPIWDQLKTERKKMFESKYRNKVSKIKTVPALGLDWLNFLDARISLIKDYKPILNEQMIEEFSEDLGIDSSFLRSQEDDENSSTESKRKTVAEVLMSNDYLANYNFETQRKLLIVFSPLVSGARQRECVFEIWNGGIRCP
ncbi:hypothetical protein KL928_004081 [Ogataea angusta]|uniref:RecA family profile 1 domain-containing protein n=1 Tax=Pichia angusta TaxID=870730 RepID=A0AAN6I4N1_PICAN|nr:uncharacterized protein KL928_004081 [Ogataea angusta]KAG7817346.1 hypothetical protein KL928_004081 [Ogataea angusta]KAG7833371.1 hypothetical protein KL943_004236 [Ogataea angusta]